MPEIIAKKSGYYALGGIRIVKLTEGETVSVSQYEFDDIVKTDWAVPAGAPVAAVADNSHAIAPLNVAGDDGDDDVDAAAESAEDAPDMEFAEALADANDKSGLDEYAAGFGVKLDRRKAASGMLEDFKAALAGK